MKLNKKVIAILSFLLFFTISYCEDIQNYDEIVTIIHTNDVHASINNFSKLATVISTLRKEADSTTNQTIFVISGGDLFSGNPVVDQYFTKGYPIIDLMNQVGYNIAVLGNHEFDYGQKTLNERMKQAQFPFVLSNFEIGNGSELNKVEPYKILTTKTGKKFLFLGLLETESGTGYPSTNIGKLNGLKFRNGIDEAKKYRDIKTSENLTGFVAISHLGEEDDAKLAGKVPELDVIIGGHSHSLISKKVKGVYIEQAGNYLNNVGKLVLKIKDNKIIEKKGELLDLPKIEKEDESIKAKIAEYNNNPRLKEVIGSAREEIRGKMELGAFMTDGVRDSKGFDIYFQNNGGIRKDSISAGEITASKIFELDPFNNRIVTIEMTPNQIKTLIKFSYEKSGSLDLHVSGIRYSVISDKQGVIKEIVLKNYSGLQLDENRKYKVGMNEYIADSYNYDGKGTGIYDEETTADALIRYLKKIKEIGSYKSMDVRMGDEIIKPLSYRVILKDAA